MRERIKSVIKRVFKLNHVRDDISQSNCDRWNSLGHLNLIVELEMEFDVSFKPEDIIEIKSLDMIEKKLNSFIAAR